ncbi:hypothetical protein ACEQ8H_004773 [Pleosporales sp. CAS-2024a]
MKAFNMPLIPTTTGPQQTMASSSSSSPSPNDRPTPSPGPVTYRSTATQIEPPHSAAEFCQIYGYKPNMKDLEHRTGLAAIGRYRRSDDIPHGVIHGNTFEVPLSQAKSSYVESGFGTMGRKECNMAIVKAKAKASLSAARYKLLMKEAGLDVFPVSKDENIVHSEQTVATIQLDKNGNLLDDKGINGRCFWNLYSKDISEREPEYLVITTPNKFATETWRVRKPELSGPFRAIASLDPSERASPPVLAIKLDESSHHNDDADEQYEAPAYSTHIDTHVVFDPKRHAACRTVTPTLAPSPLSRKRKDVPSAVDEQPFKRTKMPASSASQVVSDSEQSANTHYGDIPQVHAQKLTPRASYTPEPQHEIPRPQSHQNNREMIHAANESYKSGQRDSSRASAAPFREDRPKVSLSQRRGAVESRRDARRSTSPMGSALTTPAKIRSQVDRELAARTVARNILAEKAQEAPAVAQKWRVGEQSHLQENDPERSVTAFSTPASTLTLTFATSQGSGGNSPPLLHDVKGAHEMPNISKNVATHTGPLHSPPFSRCRNQDDLRTDANLAQVHPSVTENRQLAREYGIPHHTPCNSELQRQQQQDTYVNSTTQTAIKKQKRKRSPSYPDLKSLDTPHFDQQRKRAKLRTSLPQKETNSKLKLIDDDGTRRNFLRDAMNTSLISQDHAKTPHQDAVASEPVAIIKQNLVEETMHQVPQTELPRDRPGAVDVTAKVEAPKCRTKAAARRARPAARERYIPPMMRQSRAEDTTPTTRHRNGAPGAARLSRKHNGRMR